MRVLNEPGTPPRSIGGPVMLPGMQDRLARGAVYDAHWLDTALAVLAAVVMLVGLWTLGRWALVGGGWVIGALGLSSPP